MVRTRYLFILALLGCSGADVDGLDGGRRRCVCLDESTWVAEGPPGIGLYCRGPLWEGGPVGPRDDVEVVCADD